LTTTNRKTSTARTPIEVELETLTTWEQSPEIGRALSGTGNHEAISGRKVGPSRQVPLVGNDDLYTAGIDGQNEIVVEVNSALANVQIDRA
jgi:hypothetical protein